MMMIEPNQVDMPTKHLLRHDVVNRAMEVLAHQMDINVELVNDSFAECCSKNDIHTLEELYAAFSNYDRTEFVLHGGTMIARGYTK